MNDGSATVGKPGSGALTKAAPCEGEWTFEPGSLTTQEEGWNVCENGVGRVEEWRYSPGYGRGWV